MIVINDLLKYSNLKIYQDSESFMFSLDSVLLPNFITINKNVKNILDIGTGNAPIPLILSKLTSAHITGVEIQSSIAELANLSVKCNGLENQITIINSDIKELELEPESFDIITCNPPYFKVTSEKMLSKKDAKMIARHEVKLNLKEMIEISAKLLKDKGILGIVHRPERLTEIIDSCHQNGLEVKKIQFAYPHKNENANILLVEAVKGARSGVKVLEPIIVHEGHEYTEQVLEYFKERSE